MIMLSKKAVLPNWQKHLDEDLSVKQEIYWMDGTQLISMTVRRQIPLYTKHKNPGAIRTSSCRP